MTAVTGLPVRVYLSRSLKVPSRFFRRLPDDGRIDAVEPILRGDHK
jgi:hypothetical protein